MSKYYKAERICDECGERFWGTAGANFCSSACRSRSWRALKTLERSRAIGELCEEVARRRKSGSAMYSKLLVRLLRAVAGELRARGRNPVELLAGSPDEPATEHDDSPGGIEGTSPRRRKWVNSPALELELLEEDIDRRSQSGSSTKWQEARRARLLASLEGREPR